MGKTTLPDVDEGDGDDESQDPSSDCAGVGTVDMCCSALVMTLMPPLPAPPPPAPPAPPPPLAPATVPVLPAAPLLPVLLPALLLEAAATLELELAPPPPPPELLVGAPTLPP